MSRRESLAMVITYDLPVEADNYVHRIGRTARAGKTGRAITLASEQDVYELPAIERYIGKKIPSEIAMQEHYHDDASAGKFISIDSYDGSRTGGTRSAGARRDNFRRDDRRKPAPPKTSNQKFNKDRSSSKTEYKRKTVEQQGAEHDLSRFSMEERMALYKKKYAGKTETTKTTNVATANVKTAGVKTAIVKTTNVETASVETASVKKGNNIKTYRII